MLKLSYSTINAFQSCAHKHYLNRVEGIERIEKPRPMLFGTAFHKALEAYWGSEGELAGRLGSAGTVWELGASHFNLCPEDRILGRVLLQGYAARWGDNVEGYVAEQALVVPVLGPDGEPEPDMRLKVIPDARKTGGAAVEHKTTGSDITPGGSYWKRIMSSQQIDLYFIGCEDAGRPIDYILWDVVRAPEWRRQPATPPDKREFYKVNCKGGKKGDPKPGTRLAPETMPEFEERVTKAVLSDPESFFQRQKIYRSSTDLEKARYDLWANGKLIQAAEEAGAFPRNRDSCHKFRRPCEYLEVCHQGIDPRQSELYRIRERTSNPKGYPLQPKAYGLG